MKILIIDDERNICISLKYILDDEGYIVKWVNSCKEAINTIENWTPDLILLDVKLNFENEFVFFHQFTKTDTYIPFIMLAGINGTQEALRDIKKGAFDFIEKPLNVVKVRVTIKNAINYLLLNYEHNRIKSNTEEKYRMIGESQIFKHTMEQVKNLRKFTKCFFIYGENGTGKELLAYAIHHHSQRTDKPFIIVHTNSTTPDLLELELFGEKNMLDAQNCQIKKGKIELANKGSIFI
ncbi:MAG: sigma 54-interacting transcriptional regulator, partial [Candidatus Cloacimonetes bacterium]|nr:sigma 54-interacting transcriptional regulator [Candidatus Cloacimonadota bacterium]